MLSLSTTMPRDPPATVKVSGTNESSPVRTITQPPAVPGPVQSALSPKKKKSVPVGPAFGLKNSVHPVQRAVVEFRSCEEETGAAFMVMPVKPNAYCHGVVSAAPVPHNLATPVDGSLK